ncbi:exo-beta-1,3-glucanase [Cyathus striatus]|nr:exo-beta-1,3-glucanase [Cyathus striatus]
MLQIIIYILFCLSVLLSAYSLSLVHGFPYGSQKVRGVNLGGWLVLEPWITPSIFDNTGDSRIIDEWTFGQYQDHDKALATLTHHWDTWITESDFADIAAAGLNHVRLPIGYWAFDISRGEPYIQGQFPYLYKAVQWAQNHNLKIIIDLHGAPGSQNGFDNSGQKKPFPEWHTNSDNIERTNAVIQRLASEFKDMTGTVPVIAPLNEPAGFYGDGFLSITKQYWYDSYGHIRYPYGSDQASNTVIMIHDSFMPVGYWNGFMNPHGFEGVILDTHIYQIFSTPLVTDALRRQENQMTEQQHIEAACSKGNSLATEDIWVVVGEWTPAANDCAKYLNGRGVGARYDGSYPGSTYVGSCDGLTGQARSFREGFKDFLRRYWEAQVITYEKGQGWIQWTWKTENADEWSYQAGLENGWIPHDPTDLIHRDIC